MDSRIIELRALSKSYQEAREEYPVLRNITLSFAEGEFIVLLGRSGSGKSTLLNLISGIDLPTEGEIRVNGIALSQLSEHERTLFRRRHIGFIFQAFNLIPTLTVWENILLPLELNKEVTQEDQGWARALLNRLGLLGRESSFPDRLSGGEQQRVAIARALIHRPALVLADEPTGNLDLETGREVIKMLDGLVRETGKTLIMATHSREVIGLADRILTIRNGRLEELKMTG